MGGRGNGAARNTGSAGSTSKEVYVRAKNGAYVDRIAQLARGKKEVSFKEDQISKRKNSSVITLTESDGTKVKIRPELEYNGDAGRKYLKSPNDNTEIFTQDGIYKDSNNNRYVVTEQVTIRDFNNRGFLEIDVKSKITKVSRLAKK